MARLTQRLGFTRYEADEYYRQALEAYRKGQFDDAIDHITNAIDLAPGNSEYYAVRGFFYTEDGVKDKALADFEQALKLHPYEMLAHYGRGMIAYKDRNWDEAVAHFTDAYRADPQRPETVYYLGLACHRRGDHETALKLMQVAQAMFEQAEDRRRNEASRWVRELEKLVEERSGGRLPPSSSEAGGEEEKDGE